jgi:sialic acid synthase SpsE
MAAVLPMEVISMVFIAAEIGVNFRKMSEAKRMIGLAKDAGADGVKFQVFQESHIKGHPREKELLNLIHKQQYFQFLKNTADECGIEFFATPMYPEAVDMLEAVGVKRYKIRYADRCNNNLINAVLKTNKKILLSCDKAYLEHLMYEKKPEVQFNPARIHYIYCIPKYPPSLEEIAFPADFGDSLFNGYSNHYPSISVPLAATARGANYIEVHVKQDKYPKDYRPIDDVVSITFSELKELVRLTREIEKVIL